jgi:thioredoxin reductase (NADPH)
MHERTDVLIVGGGPAGMSAHRWCAELGLSSLLLEKNNALGGQLAQIHNPIPNYLGLAARNGREMLEHFSIDVRPLADSIRLNTQLVELDHINMRATVLSGEAITAKAFIFATGVRRRKLNVPGESEFEGRGILVSGALSREAVRGRTVAIIGGGDAALENALLLAETAKKVLVIHRRNAFTARDLFVSKAQADRRIELCFGTVVNEISGRNEVSKIRVTDNASGRRRDIGVDAVLIRIGVQPNSEMLRGAVDLDERGYVRVDHLGRTRLPNVYAVGDLANPISPTISTAVGTGATAAKSICSLICRGIDL